MKLLLFLIFATCINSLNVEKCDIIQKGNLKLHACDVNTYDHIYFHDVTGENRITIFPNRYYRNHGVIVARTSLDKLYVGTEIYDNNLWIQEFK